MNSQITTIVFDCFGVVCAPAFKGWYKEKILDRGYSDPDIYEVLKDYDRGDITGDDLVQHLLGLEGVTGTKEEIRSQIDTHLSLDEELVRVIRSIRESGYKTSLLSNGNRSFFERKLFPTYPEFKSLFDHIIISSDLGMIKPEEGIYKNMFTTCGIEPSEGLFVDDKQINVDTAVQLGMKGYVYSDCQSFILYLSSLGIVV